MMQQAMESKELPAAQWKKKDINKDISPVYMRKLTVLLVRGFLSVYPKHYLQKWTTMGNVENVIAFWKEWIYL